MPPRPPLHRFSSLWKVVLVRRKSTGVLYAMKILKKGDVVRKRQVERTKIERRVLGNVEHPFLMRLHYAFQVCVAFFVFCFLGKLLCASYVGPSSPWVGVNAERR